LQENREIDYAVGGLDVTEFSVSDSRQRFDWSAVELGPTSKQPYVMYFTHTHIDLERIYRYAAERIVKRMKDPPQKLIAIHGQQASILEVSTDGVMHVFLSGVLEISKSKPKQPPFVALALLSTWDLSTNEIRYQLVGMKQNKSQRFENLDACIRGLEVVNLFDQLECHESVLNAESVTSMDSHFGDISLHL
jgi:hypothetical protein